MNTLDFAAPQYFALLGIIPLLFIVYGAMVALRRYKLRRLGNPATLNELMPMRSVIRGWVKVTLLALAIALVVVAAARPRTGSKLRSVETLGREMLFVVDVSNSMYAEDVAPNRISCTRNAIARLISTLKDDGVGIVAFAEEAEVVMPITTNLKRAKAAANRLSPEIITNQGTNLGNAIEGAILAFSSYNANHERVMVIISDGEAHDQRAIDAAKRAAEEGITICTVGIGSTEGTVLEIDGQVMEDESGKMVMTRLNESLLQQIATESGGIYTRAENGNLHLDAIVDYLDGVDDESLLRQTFVEWDEQYQWPLGVALLLLVIEMLILTRQNPLLRGVHLFEREKQQS